MARFRDVVYHLFVDRCVHLSINICDHPSVVSTVWVCFSLAITVEVVKLYLYSSLKLF